MKTLSHYQDLIDRNPNTTFGISLAAQAVYAARYGIFDGNADEYNHEAYRDIYLTLAENMARH